MRANSHASRRKSKALHTKVRASYPGRLFKEHRFAKGETIVLEGSTGDTLFLIESGEAEVFIGGGDAPP